MITDPGKEIQQELRTSLKQLVNALSFKYQNTNELLSNNNVSIADVVFQTYDTKLAQSYFHFIRTAKSYEKKDRNRSTSISRNILTREMMF